MSVTSQSSRKPASRGIVILLLVWVAALFTDPIRGPASAAEARGTNVSAGRYLIIVETSLSMNRRATNTQKVIGDLLVSGLNGQLRPGDTVGLWTFSEDLNAGSFPLQLWTPQTRQRIAVGVVEFLRRQAYEKPARLEKVLAPMMRVVKDSDKITVLLISGGDEKVSGTPFDSEINESYKLNSSEQRKLRQPFVTVLRARKGEFIGWNVSMPPWPVEFPEFPPEPQVAKSPVSQEKPKSEQPKPEPTKPTVPSLIVIGKKPEPPASSPTNATPTEPAKAETTPETAQTRPAESRPTTITTITQQVVVVPSAPAKSETVPLAKIETTSSPAPVTVIVPDKPKAQPAPETAPGAADSVSSTNVATTIGAIAPTPVQPAPATSSPVAAAKSEPTPPAPAPMPVAQTAVATPSETIFNRTGILIAGMVLLLVALGLVYALTRRSRTPTQVSLITRSMDRDKK
jgi:hypothetical protein